VVNSAYLRVSAVAARLGVKVDVVLSWLHSGQLAGVNVAQRVAGKRPRWRIAEADLTRFLSSRAAQAPAPRQRRHRQQTQAGVIEFYREGRRVG
jgi:Helix-turn-helix domain